MAFSEQIWIDIKHLQCIITVHEMSHMKLVLVTRQKRKRTNLLKCIAQYCTLINISENQLQFNKKRIEIYMYVWKSRYCFEQSLYTGLSLFFLLNESEKYAYCSQKTVSVNEMRNQPAQLYNSFLHKLNSQNTSTPKYISINL